MFNLTFSSIQASCSMSAFSISSVLLAIFKRKEHFPSGKDKKFLIGIGVESFLTVSIVSLLGGGLELILGMSVFSYNDVDLKQ